MKMQSLPGTHLSIYIYIYAQEITQQTSSTYVISDSDMLNVHYIYLYAIDNHILLYWRHSMNDTQRKGI